MRRWSKVPLSRRLDLRGGLAPVIHRKSSSISSLERETQSSTRRFFFPFSPLLRKPERSERPAASMTRREASSLVPAYRSGAGTSGSSPSSDSSLRPEKWFTILLRLEWRCGDAAGLDGEFFAREAAAAAHPRVVVAVVQSSSKEDKRRPAAAAASGWRQRRRFLQAHRREGEAKAAEKLGGGMALSLSDSESSIITITGAATPVFYREARMRDEVATLEGETREMATAEGSGGGRMRTTPSLLHSLAVALLKRWGRGGGGAHLERAFSNVRWFSNVRRAHSTGGRQPLDRGASVTRGFPGRENAYFGGINEGHPGYRSPQVHFTLGCTSSCCAYDRLISQSNGGR